MKFPLHPSKPERLCWGCEQLCASTAMACANERSPHPVELFGPDWMDWGKEPVHQGAPDKAHPTEP
ncbi:MAG: DUF3079 domain-containing protein [Rhodoferax sp.]